MNSQRPRASAILMAVILIVSTVTAIGALIVLPARVMQSRNAEPEGAPVALIAPPDNPIATESQVFRTHSGVLAIEQNPAPRGDAHPRTLATYRALRAYPGAPPRIPHGLTPSEFLTGACKACHERGGFSERFDAYVPVTPHPEMGACLQCHVGDAKLMAISLPNTDPNTRCRQCHAPGAMRWRDSSLNWKPAAWPQLTQTVHGRNPPPIPHELQMRDNCRSCHSGPSGVAEIRTPHPERADCRECHVASGPREPLHRTAQPAAARTGSAP